MVQLKFSQSILPQNMQYADFNSNMVQLKLIKVIHQGNWILISIP